MRLDQVLWCLQHNSSATHRLTCLHHELMIAQGRFAGMACRIVVAVVDLPEVS